MPTNSTKFKKKNFLLFKEKAEEQKTFLRHSSFVLSNPYESQLCRRINGETKQNNTTQNITKQIHFSCFSLNRNLLPSSDTNSYRSFRAFKHNELE